MSSRARVGITLDDLALAYRKAKVDLYYSNSPRPLDLLEYEEELEANLVSLRNRISGRDELWVEDPDFLGNFDVVSKDVDLHLNSDTARRETFHVSPTEAWHAADKSKATAAFRLLSRTSIDFHVLAALWIGRIGAAFDGKLSDSVRGYRLRRRRDCEYNWYSSGSFEPYLMPYRKWQDDGFEQMATALEANERVVTLIADASAFFHTVDPSFLLHPGFLARIDVEMSEIDQKVHRLFSNSLARWQTHVGELLGVEVTGLPVGLPASAVVANLAMLDFDRAIETQVRPRYYGRYVDDVILVLTGVDHLQDADDTWAWLSSQVSRAPGVRLQAKDGSHIYSADYLEGSNIRFDNKKNRVLIMEGETGDSLIQSIQATIAERSSEWRSMPMLPERPEDVGPEIARAIRFDGAAADSLRTAERMTASRALFALTLRDFEAYARDLDSDSWVEHRRAFYTAIKNHILVPPTALEMDAYIPRILRMAIRCGDWGAVEELVVAMATVYLEVAQLGRIELRSAPEPGSIRDLILGGWAMTIRRRVNEAIMSVGSEAIPAETRNRLVDALRTLPGRSTERVPSSRRAMSLFRRLFEHDLANEPYRVALLPEEIRSASIDQQATRAVNFDSISPIPSGLVDALRDLVRGLRAAGVTRVDQDALERHPAIVYPTRPLSAAEIFALTRVLSPMKDAKEPADFAPWLFATRGYEVDADRVEVAVQQDDDERWVISLPRRSKPPGIRRKVRIAVSMLEIETQSWMASLHGRPDLTRRRSRRVAHLINQILASPTPPDYVVFPELALPAPWFIGIARKLAGRGVSLISGVEYLHAGGDIVRNQVWASLVTDIFGFNAPLVYRQDKQNAAPHEREHLAVVPPASLRLAPGVKWEIPPLIHHGDAWLALLVCSELTNIDYRASLRGKVDALLVPEWNQDLHTFEAMIESAALDVHAYIAQVNNRQFGDSRVRAPRSAEHERDVARVRGGINDYFVITDIDLAGLRSFQAQVSALNGPFKPLPDGFKLDKRRRVVPTVDGGTP